MSLIESPENIPTQSSAQSTPTQQTLAQKIHRLFQYNLGSPKTRFLTVFNVIVTGMIMLCIVATAIVYTTTTCVSTTIMSSVC